MKASNVAVLAVAASALLCTPITPAVAEDPLQAGDNVGVLLRGTKRDEVERGQVLAKPGSITPHTKFEAEVYGRTKDKGGRHKPFFKGYRPQFYDRTKDVIGRNKSPGVLSNGLLDNDNRFSPQGPPATGSPFGSSGAVGTTRGGK